jgi:hypothetical protein
MEGCSLQPSSVAAVGGAATVLERGPLRVRFTGESIIDGRPFRKSTSW